MEIRVQIDTQANAVAAGLAGLASGTFDRVVRSAVTFVARDYAAAKLGRIAQDIDRPRAFTRRGYDWDGAPRSGPIVSSAFVRPKQAEYLEPMEDGETIAATTIGGKTVGPVGIASDKTDAFGGGWGRKGFERKWLGPSARARAARKSSGRPYRAGKILYFSGQIAGKAGIWMKRKGAKGKGWSLRRIVSYLKSATYKPTLSFVEDGAEFGQRELPRKIMKAVGRELAKALKRP